MRRRSFLTACLAAGCGLTAGCGALAGSRSTVSLQERDIEVPEDGIEHRVTYGTADSAVAALELSQPIARASVTDKFQLVLELAAEAGLTTGADDPRLTTLRYRVRAPRAAASSPASIYVEPPPSAETPTLETGLTAAGWTVIRLATAVGVDQLPLVVRTRVDPAGAEVETVTVGLRAELETPDRRYTLSDRTTVRPGVAPGWEQAPARGGGQQS